MPPSRACSSCFVLLAAWFFVACANAVAPPNGAADGGAADASAADTATSRDATSTDASSGDDAIACASDPMCNGDPTVSALRGTCYRGRCFCNVGFWLQRDGRCGPTPPPCLSAGGVCQGGGPANLQCLAVPGLLAVGAEAADRECVAAGTGTVCCQAESNCRGRDRFDGCYVRGSDAAYVPHCVNGWATCRPGDLPELRI